MMERRTSNASLEPPRKSVELHDPGARGLESSDGEDEYFSDASEGRRRFSRPITPASPIPRTRVELADDAPSHGQVPGTDAYEKRQQDAVPDEVEIVPQGRLSQRNSQINLQRPVTPGGTPIPRTVVEKIDPSEPSHGDVPGTEAYVKRLADATPDVVLKAPGAGKKPLGSGTEISSSRADIPVPTTIITRVDSLPAHGEVEGTDAYNLRRQDAEPDKAEIKEDVASSPTIDRSIDRKALSRRASSLRINDAEDGFGDGFGDDFDDFEEGDQAAVDDDFGDFGGDFQDPGEDDVSAIVLAQGSLLALPLIDLAGLSSLPEFLEATQIYMDAMFPSTSDEKLSSLAFPELIPSDSPIFPSERSRSLWKQLVTPPPLQPPNWTKSRIRRLFLVSLGVPVDLDEILPPSKQKKLVLPDINLDSSTRKSESDKTLGSIARLKAKAANDSSNSVDSAQSLSKSKKSRQRGPPPPPELDLTAVRRICATTNAKLTGFTDEELKDHVQELESLIEKTTELLEYWLKRRDGARKEKEAFEGVIENLVRHARRVRK